MKITLLSKALSQFPQFRFRDGQKRLWNPILKKTFANLPEERVRLALVDYLILEAGFSSSRISFESPIKLPADRTSSRTDIICYNTDFNPQLLIECKAPDVKLDEKAAIQIARYNQKVGASFLLVSNGVLDFWFEIKEDLVDHKDVVPEVFQPKSENEQDLNYWQERGFVGDNLHPESRSFVNRSCRSLFLNGHHPIKYLNFDGFSPEYALGHYYRIFGLENNTKVALSLSANQFGGTRLNIVLNQDGANTAFSTSSLDLIAKNEILNTEFHSESGQREFDLRKEIDFNFERDITEMIPEIHQFMLKYS